MPASNVEQARRALGLRLREIRMDRGLSCKALAALAGWYDGSKVSKIEHGRQTPSAQDILAWCRHCDTDDQAEDLIASVRIIDGMYVEWRRRQRTGMRRLQESYTPLYEATTHFRIYQPLSIPGLLQTAEYATALLAAIISVRGIPDDTEAAVAARLERQRVLYSGARRFAIVLEEAVLHTGLGGAEVMAGQLDRLITLMSLPSVSLGIIPARPDRRMWPTVPFWIYDEARVAVELPSAEITITQPREIAIYIDTFVKHAEHAVTGAHARALITSALDQLS
ncbi:helix-turn-helix transcriptional regulator [Streptosporangium sp. NPDC051023]|uniref:helix-turn-helix domain-containing protein n=1 Tax=Streptosporangium sp. NPDC051023 TaxID=3155410 RepID=UPI0034502B82